MPAKVLVHQSCLTLCEPTYCSPPGSSVHGVLQARILERVTMPSSRGSSRPRDQTRSPELQADSLLPELPGKARILERVAMPFSRGIFPTQGLYPGLPYCRQILYCLSHESCHDLNKHTTGSLTLVTPRRGQKKYSHPCHALTVCNPLRGQPGRGPVPAESYPRRRGQEAAGRAAETHANCPQQPLQPNPLH